MPLAVCLDKQGRRYWVGSDVVLGPLAHTAEEEGTDHRRFELRSETICRQIMHDGNRVTGALIEHLPSGRREQVSVSVVAVAAVAISRVISPAFPLRFSIGIISLSLISSRPVKKCCPWKTNEVQAWESTLIGGVEAGIRRK
jgi:hypothetical protein